MSWVDELRICAGDVPLFCQLYCRITVHALDWVVSLDEIWLMSDRDRVRLIASQAPTIVISTLVYNTYKYKALGVLFCHGFQLFRSESKSRDGGSGDYTSVMVDFAHQKIISVFKEVCITEGEYAILKCATFFTAVGVSLSDDAAEIARNARRRYEYLLLKLIEDEKPNFSPTARVLRASKLLSVVPSIIRLGIIDTQYLGQMASFNMEGMKGRLSYDFHLSS
ncbi:unnamed protein product, partial [Mesorhabditis spiculigera]